MKKEDQTIFTIKVVCVQETAFSCGCLRINVSRYALALHCIVFIVELRLRLCDSAADFVVGVHWLLHVRRG